MQRLAYVEMTGFRSFKRKCRVEFPEKGLLRLKGKNLNTGGESAAGKSTIAHAIAYALGKSIFPAIALQNWTSDAPAHVALGFSDGVCIERGKKFAITDPSIPKPVQGSSAQKDEWITKYFGGLDIDMVMALTYRAQGEKSLFLKKGDADKKEFLTRILSLDRFETEMDRSLKLISVLESESARALGAYESSLKSLEEIGTPPSIDSLQAKEQTQRSQIDTIKSALEILKDTLNTLVNRFDEKVIEIRAASVPGIEEIRLRVAGLHKTLPEFVPPETDAQKYQDIITQCNDRLARLIAEDQEKVAARNALCDSITSRILGLEQAAIGWRGHERELERLRGEFAAMQTDVCPTCKREWDLAEQKRHELRVRFADEEAKLAICNRCKNDAQQLRNEFDAIPFEAPNPMIERLKVIATENKVKLAIEQSKVDAARKLHEAESKKLLAEARTEEAMLLTACEAEIGRVRADGDAKIKELRRRIDARGTELSAAQAQLGQTQRDIIESKGHRDQYARLTLQVEKAKREYDVAEEKVHVEQDFLGMIGREGFLGSIFDEILAEISDETNELLASVANTRHCTIKFVSESLTQAGKVRKEIKPIVTINGYEAPLEAGCSGGMLSVIMLAVDLALGSVISRRSGVCPGWIILDEVFNGLGAVEKDSAMEILQKYAQDRLVVVMDHTSELKGMFTQCIEITYKDGESWV